MNPYLNSLAFKLLAETPEEDTDLHQEGQLAWGKNLRHRVGGLLVTVGERMQASAWDEGLEIKRSFHQMPPGNEAGF